MISHLSCKTSFDAQKFVEHQWVCLIFVSLVWDKKNSTKYCDLSLLWIKIIDMSESSETLNGFPTKTRSTVGQKISTENFISPHSVHKTFRYQKVVKHRTVPLREFSLLWDKIIRQEITISHLSCKHFLMPRTSSNTNGFAWFLFH